MAESLHKNGPCKMQFGSIYDIRGCMIEEPSIIIDISGDTVVLLKYGSRNWVGTYYDTLIDKYTKIGLINIADDIKLFTFTVLTGFEEYDRTTGAKFTSDDDVCTIINWVNNTISTARFLDLLNMNEDKAHERIKELAELGF